MSKDHRKAELAKIHIAKKELGIGDDDYRAMLLSIGGAESAGALNARQRQMVLEHLAGLGFAGKSQGRPRNMQWRPGRISRTAQLEKIEALLTVGGKPWAYADALAKRICKVERIAWVEDRDLYKIITALRMQAKREGWDLRGEG